MSTAIQWTDVTDNIIVVKGGGWWCRKISPGCANCYAAVLNQNAFFGGNKLAYSGKVPELELRRDVIAGWERMRASKKHFVASMTDVFGDWVPQEWVFDMLDGMAAAPLQTFQVLTKRPDVMLEHVVAWLARREFRKMPRNIQLGTSVEENARRFRIALLKQCPAGARFLSLEPLLEDITSIDPLLLNGIDWVIVGGESGSGARPCDVEWIRAIVQQCKAAAVPCFVKQLGSYIVGNGISAPGQHWSPGIRRVDINVETGLGFRYELNHRKGGDPAEWPADLRVREFPRQGETHD